MNIATKELTSYTNTKNVARRYVGNVDMMVDPLPHGFGEQVITWQDGRPVYMKISYTEKM